MIINPIVAAAATVAAKAVGTLLPGDWLARRPDCYRSGPSFRDPLPANEYFIDMDDTAHEQARELEAFMANTPSTTNTNNPPIDAEILNKESTTQYQSSRKPPPLLPNTNNPMILLGLDPGANFDAVRRAYKVMVMLYHPDVVVGPDASADEQQAANWEFARINAAFDILKRKENEEVLEYNIYVDGERVIRSVAASEESRQRDSTYINYDRIAEMAEYRKRHPTENMWYENDYDYQTRYGGFEVDESNYDSYSRVKWTDRRAFEHDHDIGYTHGHNGFGHIPSNEQIWDESQMPTQHQTDDYRYRRSQDQWRNENENHAFDFGVPPNHHDYQPRSSQHFDAQMKQGYPYKDRRWHEMPSFDEARFDQTNENNAYDYDPQ